jgi:hypothetical protein
MSFGVFNGVIEDKFEPILVLGEFLMPFERFKFCFGITLFDKEDLSMVEPGSFINLFGPPPIHVVQL